MTIPRALPGAADADDPRHAALPRRGHKHATKEGISYGQLGLAPREEVVIAAHYPDLRVPWIVTWRSSCCNSGSGWGESARADGDDGLR